MGKNKESKGYELDRDMNDTIMVSVRHINRCDTHFHKQIELIYSHANNLKIELDQQVVTLSKGDFAIAHSYCLHRYNDIKLTTVICVPLKYTAIFNGFKQIGGACAIIKASVTSKRILKAAKKLRQFKTVNPYRQDSLMYGLVGAIYDAYKGHNTEKSVRSGEISIKIIEYINSHYSENINLESLATHCGYSKNYISTVFNSSFQCNFNEYLNLIRLQAFVETQSASSSGSIIDAATAVGFNSPRTFFNAFKERYKMTPKEYLSLRK